MLLKLPIGTDFTVRLIGLVSQVPGTTVAAASVLMTLYDGSMAPVTGQSWPATLAPEATQPGNYTGLLSATLGLSFGAHYTLEVIADNGFQMRHTWRMNCRATWDDQQL